MGLGSALFYQGPVGTGFLLAFLCYSTLKTLVYQSPTGMVFVVVYWTRSAFGTFSISLIGLKRILFTKIFQGLCRANLVELYTGFWSNILEYLFLVPDALRKYYELESLYFFSCVTSKSRNSIACCCCLVVL